MVSRMYKTDHRSLFLPVHNSVARRCFMWIQAGHRLWKECIFRQKKPHPFHTSCLRTNPNDFLVQIYDHMDEPPGEFSTSRKKLIRSIFLKPFMVQKKSKVSPWGYRVSKVKIEIVYPLTPLCHGHVGQSVWVIFCVGRPRV